MRYDCYTFTWIFSNNNRKTSTLFENGQIHEAAAAKSDRLRVTSDCSLVIEKVSVEDVGWYTCRQFINGQQTSEYSYILSVIQMVQQNQKDKIILTCSVMDYNDCRHTVKWLNEGREEMLSDMEESYQSCSDTVTIPTSDRNWKENSEILECRVTNSYSKNVQLFNFRIQFSGGKTDKISTVKTPTTTRPPRTTTTRMSTTTTTTRPPRTTTTRMSTTTKMTTAELPATLSIITTESNKLTSMAINSTTNVNNFSKTSGWFVFYIIGPAVIIVTVLVIIGWKKTRGNKTKKEGERKTDPEDNIHYSKVIPTKKTKKKPRVPDTVTYSTLNISSSAAAQPTIDLDRLYSTLSK
ncbi:uncharacterized protein LOC122825845 [Gambusia affinis]|uniref:uncharacterized protein LOC122825845 n=1 Tax=Gambusia affinis TaxID=33528 RepID=UPI001CDC41AF|nr:uncharacterized protein LOC122825845 [Gambusia affinis]